MTLSLEGYTADWLRKQADRHTSGNVSALVDELVKDRALAESTAAHARWYAQHPGYADAAEAERYAA